MGCYGGDRATDRCHAQEWSKNGELELRSELAELRAENNRLGELVAKLSELVLVKNVVEKFKKRSPSRGSRFGGLFLTQWRRPRAA